MSYRPADPRTLAMVKAVRSQHHQRLKSLSIAVVVNDGAKVRPLDPIKVRSHSAASRAAGSVDTYLILDRPLWDAADERTRRGWIDNALASLVVPERDGTFSRDLAGRPLTKRRTPTHHVSTYGDVIARSGRDLFDPFNDARFRSLSAVLSVVGESPERLAGYG